MNNDRFKFREPLRCSVCNKFAYWIFDLKGRDFGKFDRETCGCSMFDCTKGYERCGDTEQCTGLKDKNDKLIYDNDIVKDKWGRVMRIVWREDTDCSVQGCFQFMAIINPMNNFNYAPFSSWWDFDDKCLEVEIVGNIHENGELLEKDDES